MSTLKAALLGRSLAHSISPEVHWALFPILRLNVPSPYDSIDYCNIECVDEADFLDTVRENADEGFVGFNVTFPYKYLASQLENDVDSVVRRINSANTLLCAPSICVHSTDGAGFKNALSKELPNLDAAKYTLLIVGAGGAARAVYFSLREVPWQDITVATRSLSEAQRSFAGATCLLLDQLKRDAGAYFIVQATPVGQRSNESLLQNFEWHRQDIAVDLVYNPLRTRFLDIAAKHGAQTIDGLGMLIEQAELSQYLWMTGNETVQSPLSLSQFRMLHDSLATHVHARWDDSAF